MAKFNIFLAPDEIDQVGACARAEGKSLRGWIRHAVLEAIEHHPAMGRHRSVADEAAEDFNEFFGRRIVGTSYGPNEQALLDGMLERGDTLRALEFLAQLAGLSVEGYDPQLQADLDTRGQWDALRPLQN